MRVGGFDGLLKPLRILAGRCVVGTREAQAHGCGQPAIPVYAWSPAAFALSGIRSDAKAPLSHLDLSKSADPLLSCPEG